VVKETAGVKHFLAFAIGVKQWYEMYINLFHAPKVKYEKTKN
jgi:hypothetical protein